MDPTIKAKWLDALRSGNYQQGRRGLRSADGSKFCCLGVLCDVVAPDKWGSVTPSGKFLLHDEKESYPRGELLDSVGLVPASPLADVDVLFTLGRMNDDEGATFEVIADWIEVNL